MHRVIVFVGCRGRIGASYWNMHHWRGLLADARFILEYEIGGRGFRPILQMRFHEYVDPLLYAVHLPASSAFLFFEHGATSAK